MSYASLLKNIPDFLSQPTGIAVLASLGIHGAIAFLLPLVPVDSKPKQQVASTKTVGLIELNQAEQNRLPQNNTSQVSLQPVPSLPQLPPPPSFATQQQSLAPLPPSSTTQSVLPPLPQASTISISSLPKAQSLRIIPKRDLQANPISSSINTRGIASQPPQLPRVQEKVALGESQPLPPSNLQELQAAKTSVDLQPVNSLVQPVKTAVDLPSSNSPIQPLRTKAAPGSRLPHLQAANLPVDLQRVSSVTQNSTNTTPVNSSATSATTELTSRSTGFPQNRQLLAPIGAVPQTASNNLTLAGASSLRSQLQSNGGISELSSNPKVPAKARPTTFGEEFLQVKQQYPNIETKLPISGTIAIKAGQEGRVDGALVVDNQGRVERVNFLDNSISSDQKTAAREYLREYLQNNPAQTNGKPKYYPFTLAFKANSGTPEAFKQTSQQPHSNSLTRENTNGVSSQVGTTPRINQQPVSTEARQKLIQRLHVSLGSTQPSNEHSTSLSENLSPSQQRVKPLQQRQSTQNSPQTTAGQVPQHQMSSNQTSTSVESGRKLVQRLRHLRENRQSPRPDLAQ